MPNNLIYQLWKKFILDESVYVDISSFSILWIMQCCRDEVRSVMRMWVSVTELTCREPLSQVYTELLWIHFNKLVPLIYIK